MPVFIFFCNFARIIQKIWRKTVKKVCVITGASQGIGLATAKKLNSLGYIVYDLSRSNIENTGIKHISCDVTNVHNIENAISTIINSEGRIDLAISNAGFGIAGPHEECSYEMIERQINVNILGTSLFARYVLPYIRNSRGRLILISSVAAYIPIPFQAMYSASKAAIYALGQAIDLEIKPSGARAIVVMPGDLATNFTKNRQKVNIDNSFYKARCIKSLARMEHDEQSGKSATWAAERIVRLAEKKNPSVINTLGCDYKFFALLTHILPNRLIRYIVTKLYA